MNDDLRDLLDPDDDRVESALQRIRTDLLVGPDEVTAARHRRLRRSLAERPSVRRTAVAIVLAVVGTGAALTAVAAPPVVPGAPAGQDAEPHVIDTSSTVWFPAPPTETDPHLPTYVEQLPPPPPRGPATVDRGPGTEHETRPQAPRPDPLPGPPAHAPGPPTHAPGPPAHAPGGAPETPVGPRPPATGEAPARPDGDRPQPLDPGRSGSTGDAGAGAPEGDAPAEGAPDEDRQADSARDRRPAPPPADGGR